MKIRQYKIKSGNKMMTVFLDSTKLKIGYTFTIKGESELWEVVEVYSELEDSSVKSHKVFDSDWTRKIDRIV